MAKTAMYIVGSILFGILYIGVIGCSNPVAEESDHTPGQLIVHFTEIMSHQDVTDLTDSYEIELLEYFEFVGIALVGVPEGQEVMWKEKLEKNNLISSVSLVRNNVTLR